MKRTSLLQAVVFLIVLSGCASILPSIQSQHPNGYSKLIIDHPECQSPDLKNYNACLSAAKLIECTSSEQVTVKFISHWEEAAFGMADRRQKVGEGRDEPRDAYLESSVWSSVKHDAITATERIVVPVAKKIYADSNTDYSVKMLKQADLIDLNSRSSFDSFRTIHTELLKTAP